MRGASCTSRKACWSTPDPGVGHLFPMFALLVLRNMFRHKLRTTLTVVGIVVAITAFGLLRTIVEAWYAGAEATSSTRLVTRNAISLVFPLPLTYAQKLRQVDGVSAVSWANWFGGVYINERNFFPQFGIDADTYLDMYPEFVIDPAERKAFLRRPQRRGRRTQARQPVRLEARRPDPDPRHDLPGHLEVHAARDLRRRRRQDRRDPVLFPLEAPQRDDQAALSEARRPGRRLHRRDPRPDARRGDLAGDRRHVQAIRWPRR